MDINQRTQTMDTISRAGDAAVLKFASYCMRILESGEAVTMDDAQAFIEEELS